MCLKIINRKAKQLELEREKLIDEMNHLSKDIEYDPEEEFKQNEDKVKNSKVFERHAIEMDNVRKLGERKASLQHRMQGLLKQKEDITNDLQNKEHNREKNRDRGGSRQHWRDTDYLIAGENIMNTMTPIAKENEIKLNQERIKQLIKDRQKTLDEIEDLGSQDPFDSIGIDYDSKFYDQVRDYYGQIGSQPGASSNKKIRHLDYVRTGLKKPFMTTELKLGAKPYLDKKLTSINSYIRDHKNKSAIIPFKKAIQNMNISLPPASPYHPNSKPSKALRLSSPHPPLSRNFSLKKTSSVPIRPPSQDKIHRFLPDVGVFKQNLGRAEDLEVEERAIMNMYAQDFDELKLLNMLEGDQDLYAHKIKQYLQSSQFRTEAEKELQRQRMHKLKQHFDRQMVEEDRQSGYQRWVDDTSKNVIRARIKQSLSKSEEPKEKNVRLVFGKQTGYSPENGFEFYVDYLSNLPKSDFGEIKLVYAIFCNDQMLVGNQQMGPVLVSPDTYSVTHNKAVFSMKQTVKNIITDPANKLVIEIQAQGKKNYGKFNAISWTMANLFNSVDNSLNKGLIKLPLFEQPTDPYIPVHQIVGS